MRDQQYLDLLQKIKQGTYQEQDSQYDVVINNNRLPPVKSNLYSDKPLRPKPPSEQMIQVSPSPHDYSAKDKPLQYGVNNPHWFSNEVRASTPGYGPEDFVVETVNLDKNFFYQFFTSKPMIIDTDVVTSTSMQVNYDKQKKGRESPMSDMLESPMSSLPEPLVDNEIQQLKQAFESPVVDREQILNTVSKFKRYNVPAEVRVTHNLAVPSSRSKKELEGEQHIYQEEAGEGK